MILASNNRIVYGDFSNIGMNTTSDLARELDALNDPGAADCNICRAVVNRIFQFTYPEEFNHESVFNNASRIAQASTGRGISLQQQSPRVQKEIRRLQELFEFSGVKTQ